MWLSQIQRPRSAATRRASSACAGAASLTPSLPEVTKKVAALVPAATPQTFASTVTQHYLTNPICRASYIMAECHAVIEPAQEGTGTHG